MRLFAAVFISTVVFSGYAQDTITGTLPYAEKATIAQVERLLAAGAGARTMKETDSLGRTLLHLAAATGSLDLVKKALAGKPALNDSDIYGGNAISWAVYSGSLPVIKYLRSLGVPYSPSACVWIDTAGEGPYYGSTFNIAAGRKKTGVEVMKYLLDSCKADVNELEYAYDRSHTGWTAAHWAVNNNDTAKLAFLLGRKANPGVYSQEEGATPLAMALVQEKPDCAAMLKKHGAAIRFDTAGGNSYGSLDYLMHVAGVDSGIVLGMRNGVGLASRITVDSTVTPLTLAVAGEGTVLDSLLALDARSKTHVDKSSTLINAVIHLKPAAVDRLCAAGARIGKGSDDSRSDFYYAIFSSEKLLYPGAQYQFNDTLPRPLRDSLLLACLKTLERYTTPLCSNDREYAGFFTECVKHGFNRCMEFMIDQGVPVGCLQDNESDFFATAMQENDSALIAKLAAAGAKIMPESFQRGSNCRTVAQALAIARGQEIVDTNAGLVRASLRASAFAGCFDLVPSLSALDAARAAKVVKDGEDDIDAYKGDTVSAHTLLIEATGGTQSDEVIRWILDKKASQAEIDNIAAYCTAWRLLPPSGFDYLMSKVSMRKKNDLDRMILKTLGDCSYPSAALPAHLVKRFRASRDEGKMIGLARGLIESTGGSDSLLRQSGFPASKRESGVLAAALVLAGDTAKAGALLKNGVRLPKRGTENQPLVEECIMRGNQKGVAFLRSHGVRIANRDLKRLYVDCLEKALGYEEGYGRSNEREWEKVLEMLFTIGAQPAWTGNSRMPLLIRALARDRLDIARVLVARGVPVRVYDSIGRTPLFFAVEAEDSALVKTLLEKGADPAIALDSTRRTPRKKAAGDGDDGDMYRREQEDATVRELAGTAPLNIACERGMGTIARMLVEAGAKIETKNAVGRTPLIDAADRTCSYPLCSLLVARGADVTARSDEDPPKTALGLAVTNQDSATIALLLARYRALGAAIDDPTLLHEACEREIPLRVVEEMVALGSPLNGRDQQGRTPVYKTINYRYAEALDSQIIRQKALFTFMVDKADLGVVDNDGVSLLSYAAGENDTAAMALLLVKTPALLNKRDNTGRTALMIAVKNQRAEATGLLLAARADASVRDNEGNNALHLSAKVNDTVCMKMLLDRKATIDARNNENFTPLLCAAADEQWEAADLLVSRKADAKVALPDGTTVLHYAAAAGRERLVRACLKAGVPVNGRNRDGETALLIAVRRDVPGEFVCMLIKAGADPSIMNYSNESVLHKLASSTEGYPCMEQIFAAAKNVDITNSEGRTPLMFAAKTHSPVFELLLARGAALDRKDNEGLTPLMIAAVANRNGHLAEALKRKPPVSLINEKNGSGQTALHLAVRENNYIGAMMLIEAGADVSVVDGEGRSALWNAVNFNCPPLVIALRKRGATLEGKPEKLKSLAEENASGDDANRLFELLTLPPERLPPAPPATLTSLEGYWWHQGSIPLKNWKTKECMTIQDNEKTLETTDEVLWFTPYDGGIILRGSVDMFRNDYSRVVLVGDKLTYGNSDNRCEFSRDGDVLTIKNKGYDRCEIFRYAGKTFDVQGFRKAADEEDVEELD